MDLKNIKNPFMLNNFSCLHLKIKNFQMPALHLIIQYGILKLGYSQLYFLVTLAFVYSCLFLMHNHAVLMNHLVMLSRIIVSNLIVLVLLLCGQIYMYDVLRSGRSMMNFDWNYDMNYYNFLRSRFYCFNYRDSACAY